MDNTDGGLIGGMLDWIHHPRFTKADPIDYLLWAVLLMLLGLAWSKVIRQTLDSTITTINKVAD
jgi:membrane protein DedA with SNARE-associated domain